MSLYVPLWNRQLILDAQLRIQAKTIKTPVIASVSLSNLASTIGKCPTKAGSSSNLHLNLLFKCENLQRGGSFKLRGATNILSKLSDSELRRGVVSHSTGNHAQALAIAANVLSTEKGFPIPICIVLPQNCPPSKVASVKSYGAELYFSGNTFHHRKAMAEQIQIEKRAIWIPSLDHPDLLEGSGTVAVEFLEQVHQSGEGPLDCIIVPCGGGGLLSGTAVACHGTSVKVFGCEPEEGGADEVVRGIKEGQRIVSVNSSTIADGLVGVVGESYWEIINNKDYVEGVFSVSDQQIRDAMKLLIEETKLLVEPSSAVPLAMVLYNQEFRQLLQKGWKIGIVLTGGNISLSKLLEVLDKCQK